MLQIFQLAMGCVPVLLALSIVVVGIPLALASVGFATVLAVIRAEGGTH